jgi:hypothetical protein
MIAARKQKKEKRAELEKRESNALMRENSEEREGFWENLHSSTCSIFFPNSSRFKTRERERERTREPCDREREGEKEREKEITRVERRG